MKLSVSLNTKSIQNAVKSLQTARKQLAEKMVEDLLIGCCERIIARANANLDTLDLGENVKRGIQSSWIISAGQDGKITLLNTWHKDHGQWQMAAAYVEFGVGINGEGSHPEADEAGYEYNLPSSNKDEADSWYFWTDAADLDLPQNVIIPDGSKRYGNRLKVRTRGTQATRFLYNAVMEFYEQKEAETIWQQIKEKYWG